MAVSFLSHLPLVDIVEDNARSHSMTIAAVKYCEQIPPLRLGGHWKPSKRARSPKSQQPRRRHSHSESRWESGFSMADASQQASSSMMLRQPERDVQPIRRCRSLSPSRWESCVTTVDQALRPVRRTEHWVRKPSTSTRPSVRATTQPHRVCSRQA